MTESDHCCMCINNLDLDQNACIASGIMSKLIQVDQFVSIAELQESICREAGCLSE